MAKPFKEWTVLPHGELTRLDDRILVVSGLLNMPPMGQVERRMTVVRLRGGGLVVYSAIALGETQMRTLESFGNPEGLRGWLFRAIGLTGDEPHIAAPVRMREVRGAGTDGHVLGGCRTTGDLRPQDRGPGCCAARSPRRITRRGRSGGSTTHAADDLHHRDDTIKNTGSWALSSAVDDPIGAFRTLRDADQPSGA